MPAFEFKGINASGKEVSGVRDADSEKALRSLLKREGVFLTRVGKGSKKGQSVPATEVDLSKYFERINATDIALFTRQLATLTKASIPLVEALAATAEQAQKGSLRKILAELKQDVVEGASLAGALKKHEAVLDPSFRIWSKLVKRQVPWTRYCCSLPNLPRVRSNSAKRYRVR